MEDGVCHYTTKEFLDNSEDNRDLNEILEIEQLSKLLEQFHSATGLSNAVLDLKGNILFEGGWKSICTEFHRKSKNASGRCTKSDTILADRLLENERYAIYTCQNGMVDAAVPIIIEGVHVANLFMGQFFFEKPDRDMFISQAEEFGFDKEKYMKALEECQIYSRETIENFLEFFYEFVNVISESAQKTLRLQKHVKDEKERSAELFNAESKLVCQNDEIFYIDSHDDLTGLYNRIYFESEKKRVNFEGQFPVSIVVGDINGLKLINYGFGHAKGDEVIIEIAKIIKKCCREEDVVSRIGGGEFSILLPRTDEKSAQQVCRRIYDACRGCTFVGNEIYPSISLGYATKLTKAETVDDILMTAEKSMSKKKLLESHSAHSAIIASIKAIMFEKSQETEEHAERLVQLSKSIGVALAFTDDQLNELELFATLHDIGKVSISNAILLKPDELCDEEWAIMKRHPEVGCRIAQVTSELAPIAKYILSHHERWDGKGYPYGLAGGEIPLLSRILAVVDSFDAMTNDRAYRKAMTKEDALAEIRNCSGTQFDPYISQLFLKLIK